MSLKTFNIFCSYIFEIHFWVLKSLLDSFNWLQNWLPVFHQTNKIKPQHAAQNNLRLITSVEIQFSHLLQSYVSKYLFKGILQLVWNWSLWIFWRPEISVPLAPSRRHCNSSVKNSAKFVIFRSHVRKRRTNAIVVNGIQLYAQKYTPWNKFLYWHADELFLQKICA